MKFDGDRTLRCHRGSSVSGGGRAPELRIP